MTYIEKLAEAKAWLLDNTATVPFLAAEAAAISTTVAALVAEVMTAATAWGSAGAKIEAARRKAKVDIAAASNVGEIHTATQIDWAAVLA